MSDIKPYHNQLAELTAQLAEHGSLSVVLLDCSSFEAIEEEYGSNAFQQVRGRVLQVFGFGLASAAVKAALTN